MAKTMLPQDLARILGNKVTGDPPEINLTISDIVTGNVIDPPFDKVTVNLDTGAVVLFTKFTFASAFQNFLLDLIGKFRAGEIGPRGRPR